MNFDLKIYASLMDSTRKCPNKRRFEKVRLYLDACGMKMPQPKWIYNEDDKKTAMWLEGRLNVHPFTKRITHVPALNPEFAYNNLI